MKKRNIIRISGLGVFPIFLICLLGCYSYLPTKPNPANTDYPGYDEFRVSNPLLAKELGKLPELKDGISPLEVSALDQLLHLYKMNPRAFDRTFKRMYKVGLPEVRAYCSPLQGLFWLAEDGKFKETASIVQDYSLHRLLESAWSFEDMVQGKILRLSEEQIQEITRYLDEKESAWLEKFPPEQKNKFISIRYAWEPNAFPKEAREIIKRALGDERRWHDFYTVISSLNAPELIDYYERKRIRYHYEPLHDEDFAEVLYVFNNNRGHCAMITAFTVYCFKKAGYKVATHYVDDPGGSKPHRICLFEVDGKKYIMDNGRPYPLGIIPYDQYRFSGAPYLYEMYEKAWKVFH